MTGSEAAPAQKPIRKWVKYIAMADGRIGTQRGVSDCMLAKHLRPTAYGYQLAGSPESEARRAAVAQAVRAYARY